jgi:hypothetical protein
MEEIMNELLISGFTRKETLILTDCSSAQLTYLETKNLVTPQRLEETGRKTVLFSLNQLIQIKIIRLLKAKSLLSRTKLVMEFLLSQKTNERFTVMISIWDLWRIFFR